MADEVPDEDERGGTWHWAYLIPIMALLIPIIAVAGESAVNFVPVLVTLLIVGGMWAGGRNLLGYRHELRMKELELEQKVRQLEAEQLREAQRVLDLDDRIGELRDDVAGTTPPLPESETPETA